MNLKILKKLAKVTGIVKFDGDTGVAVTKRKTRATISATVATAVVGLLVDQGLNVGIAETLVKFVLSIIVTL